MRRTGLGRAHSWPMVWPIRQAEAVTAAAWAGWPFLTSLLTTSFQLGLPGRQRSLGRSRQSPVQKRRYQLLCSGFSKVRVAEGRTTDRQSARTNSCAWAERATSDRATAGRNDLIIIDL